MQQTTVTQPTPPAAPPGAPQPAAAAPVADAAQPIVRVVDLHKSFGKLVVLDGVTLDIERGKTTVILGPSGTGKSVLLKHIVGLLRPDKGQVLFEGQHVDTMTQRELIAVRRRVGFLFQQGALFDSMSVEQNIAFPLIEHTKLTLAERAEAVARGLAMVGLSGTQKKMPAELSGGQRKRIALARAIVLEPSLVLYDEPTTGLDPIRADVINELIITLATHLGITSIVVTHDMVSANRIADRMVLLYDGKIVADGTPEQFLKSENDRVQRFIKGQADEEDLKKIRRAFDTPNGARA